MEEKVNLQEEEIETLKETIKEEQNDEKEFRKRMGEVDDMIASEKLRAQEPMRAPTIIPERNPIIK